jgi:hypothetical protein
MSFLLLLISTLQRKRKVQNRFCLEGRAVGRGWGWQQEGEMTQTIIRFCYRIIWVTINNINLTVNWNCGCSCLNRLSSTNDNKYTSWIWMWKIKNYVEITIFVNRFYIQRNNTKVFIIVQQCGKTFQKHLRKITNSLWVVCSDSVATLLDTYSFCRCSKLVNFTSVISYCFMET